MDPPRTAESTNDNRHISVTSGALICLKFRAALTADLLQCRGAQLDGDVGEQAVPLRAEVPDDVRVRVRLPEKLHLPLCYLETLGQDSLDSDMAPIKFTSKVIKNKK